MYSDTIRLHEFLNFFYDGGVEVVGGQIILGRIFYKCSPGRADISII